MRKILGVIAAAAALALGLAGAANAVTPAPHPAPHPAPAPHHVTRHINYHGRNLVLDDRILFYPGFGLVGFDVRHGHGTTACAQATAAVTAERQLLAAESILRLRGHGHGGVHGYHDALWLRSRLLVGHGPLRGQAGLQLAALVQEQAAACA